MANILLAHAGRGGGRGVTEAAAEIARAAARSWLAPLLDSACDRLAFVLGNLFDLALERNRFRNSECKRLLSLLSCAKLFDRFFVFFCKPMKGKAMVSSCSALMLTGQ